MQDKFSGQANGLANVMGAIAAAAILGAPSIGSAQQAFVETFDTLDRDRWYVSDGWVNGPHQNCQWSAKAASVQGGVLRLTLDKARAGEQDYICAEIQSEDRFGYGVFEASLRVPFAAGTNSNFFTYIGPTQSKPHNEIDFEFLSRTQPSLQTNIYKDGKGGNEQLVPVTDKDGWHDIAMVWEPGRLRWYMNGALVREVTGDTVPSEAQKMYLSIWSTDVLTDWMGRFEWTGPLVMQVERVAYSPLGTVCPFSGSILCAADFSRDTPPVNN
jgi:endo-1,3-1,4-beta-glycanase ExoK